MTARWHLLFGRELAVAGAALHLALGCAEGAADPYAPPFGLRWGDGRSALDRVAARAGARPEPVGDRSADNRESWAIPFSGEAYRQAQFTFLQGELIESTLRYPVSSDGDSARTVLQRLRVELEKGLGPGELVESGSETGPENYRETRRVYQWSLDGRVVWLTSVELAADGGNDRRAEVILAYADLGLTRRLELGEGGGGRR